MSDRPDHSEALRHIRTLVRMASETDDVDMIRKLLSEMRRIVDRALLDQRKARLK